MAHNWKSLLVGVVLCVSLLAGTTTAVSNAAVSSSTGSAPAGSLAPGQTLASPPAQAPNTSGTDSRSLPREITPTRLPPDDNTGGQPIPLQERGPLSPPPNVDTGAVQAPSPASEPVPLNRGTDAEVRPSTSRSPAGIQAIAAAETTFFPATGDEVVVGDDPYWWQAGDYAQGTRTLSLNSVSGVHYHLVIDDNALNTTGHIDLDLSINGTVVGSFSILPGETSKTVAFFFPPISAPSYVIRLEEINTVDPGAGSASILLDTSTITFYDSTTSLFPGTGDVVSVVTDPYWWNAGDYAEGARTIGLDSVSGVRYDLIIYDNALNTTGHVDLDLSINGTVVGSFSILPGETTKSVIFFFPPISGPTYTIRLEETNTVDPGAGSVAILLDTSVLRFYDSTSSWFPATGDVVSVVTDPYWWNAGDYAQGMRTPGLDTVTGVRFELMIDDNALDATGHVDLDLSINGTVVGSFSILPGDTTKTVSFFFPPLSGPTYTIRLEETNTVDPGAGSVAILLDTSALTFYDSTQSPFMPATGDLVHVQSAPFWWHAGDYAEGTRISRLGSVTSVQYDLMLSRNSLNTTGHVDLELSINGLVVSSFSVLPGEMSKSGIVTFAPISGPIYVIRLEETNLVEPGGGSIVIPLDRSPIQLGTSVFLPVVAK